MKRGILFAMCVVVGMPLFVGCAENMRPGGIVISGNENKLDLTTGAQKPIFNAAPDSLSIINFATFPPKVTTINNVPNSVVGPPSNIAISRNGRMALIANSLKLDATAAAGWVPESYVHILDLTANPPKVIGKVKTDAQPSGLSITPDDKWAIVANRAAGTVNVLAIDGLKVTNTQSLKVCEPAESASDVAISPDGKFALVSIQKGGTLAILNIDAGKVSLSPHKISAYGQPYRVVITPDGELALSPGSGYGNGLDQDAMTIVDLKVPGGPRATEFVSIGTTLESMEISPDGKLAAVVAIEGSNTVPESPIHSSAGAVVILKREGKTYVKSQRLPVGRIPEGVAFTNNGKYLLVQCHPDRKIWIFKVGIDGNVTDTGQRIETPGMPSSIRAAMIPQRPY